MTFRIRNVILCFCITHYFLIYYKRFIVLMEFNRNIISPSDLDCFYQLVYNILTLLKSICIKFFFPFHQLTAIVSQLIKQVMYLWRWYDFLTGRFLTALEFLICIPDFADKSIINLNRHYLISVLVRLLVNDNFFNQSI